MIISEQQIDDEIKRWWYDGFSDVLLKREMIQLLHHNIFSSVEELYQAARYELVKSRQYLMFGIRR